jgi:hypothetical protein
MCAAMRQRIDVIERRKVEFEDRGAVHTTASTIPHGGAFDRALLVARWHLLGSARSAGNAGERYTVKLPTS